MAATAAAPEPAELTLPGDKYTIMKDAPSHLHTPPASDMSSLGRKEDDAASSSSLSDIGDQVEEDTRFEDGIAGAGAGIEEVEAPMEIKPDRYEGGIPIFTPSMEEFKDFEKYVKGVNQYGMKCGIVVIDPPEEWKRARKALDEAIKTIKVKNPITQEFHGAQGIYTQRNMEKQRSYNLPQWKALCEATENQPPAKRGERRLNADKLLGRGLAKNKQPLADGEKRKAGRPRVRPLKEESTEETEGAANASTPPTPISPDNDTSVPAKSVEDDDEDDTESIASTPAKGRRAKPGRKAPAKPRGKPGPKPKGQTEKSVTKDADKSGKGGETTIAARRLRNAHEAGEVDEEAFKDFDYRVYDNDQWTQQRCDELEDKYWKSLSFSNPMYGADMPGSLFDEDTKEWNVAKLPNLLDLIGAPIPGVNTAYLYLGMWRATFAWHLEDVDLYSINYIHFGAPKQWYSISQADAPKFEKAMKSLWAQDAKNCDQFLRHKTYLVAPQLLKQKYGVTVNKVVHRERQFVITFPIGYHSGYNLGYNCAESVNFAMEEWLQYGKVSKKCQCEADSVFIDVDWFIRKMNGEPSPEYEEVEVTDDEDDEDVMDLPTPADSNKGRGVKVSSKRKRNAKDIGPNKKAKKIIKVRKVSKHQPCCLCPNDFPWEQLLPTDNDQRAHRKCALYTPETFISTEGDQEKIMGVANISKDRLELKCMECRQKKGSCFQCTQAKCVRSYHATCASQAGVQVDQGEIAVWHEGVEYRDIGFDWRCRMHRTVKKGRYSSDLVASNTQIDDETSTDLNKYLRELKPNDLLQWQVSYLDDIEAGVVISGYDDAEGTAKVKILPSQKQVRDIQPTWILFVDSTTSRLQKPTANAKDLPDDLQGKIGSNADSAERLPSVGDTFTENPKTEWDEFVLGPAPRNKIQKKTDLEKSKQLWHYLGRTSTESKAQYSADPTRTEHDPASNFLQTVEPAQRPIMPPPQPRRQSLAASYPNTSTAQANVEARNAAMVNARRELLQRQFEEQRRSWPGYNAQAQMPRPMPSAQQQEILQRQQQRAHELDRQLQRQRSYQTVQRSPPNPAIGIDMEAVERQRLFQLRAAQESRAYNGWSARNIPSPQTPSNLPLIHNSPSPLSNSTMSSPAYQRYGVNGSYVPVPSQYQQAQYHLQTPQKPSPSQVSPVPQQQHLMASTQALVPRMPAPATRSYQHATGLGITAGVRNEYIDSYNDRMRLQKEKERIEQLRALANQQQTADKIEQHERRLSNPAYPFKPPQDIAAQKDEREQSTSRPSTSHSQGHASLHSSPNVKHEQPPYQQQQSFQMGGAPNQQPLDFINPNMTQINGNAPSLISQKSMPPPPAPVRPSTSGRPSSQAGNNCEKVLQWHSGMSLPSEKLRTTFAPRPTLPTGNVANERPVPVKYGQWRRSGGFLGEVAGYFIRQHVQSPTIYKSPWDGNGEERDAVGPAEQYYEHLDDEKKALVDAAVGRASGDGDGDGDLKMENRPE